MAAKKVSITMPEGGGLSREFQKNFKKGGGVGKANAKPKMFMKKMGKK
jgi:hypothetical protein